LTAGLLVTALLPLAAVVSAEPAAPTPAPVAITQPLAAVMPMVGGRKLLPESGLLLLVGSGLLGLAAVMRRATRT
jgi:hypothetical protein